jgi:hypothetical protein
MLAGAEGPSKSGGDMTFTEYGAPLTISEPSAAQSIDGSALGL